MWIVGDSQADGIIDWVTGRRDPATEKVSTDSANLVAYPVSYRGRDLTVVDLAQPGCDGGGGTTKIIVFEWKLPEGDCVRWPNQWPEATRRWGQPDAVVWMLGGATAWIRRFTVDDQWKLPVDDGWRAWWAPTVEDRLDWLTSNVAGTPVVWTTPFEPVRDQYDPQVRPGDDLWARTLESVRLLPGLQRLIAASYPQVTVADLAGVAAVGGTRWRPAARDGRRHPLGPGGHAGAGVALDARPGDRRCRRPGVAVEGQRSRCEPVPGHRTGGSASVACGRRPSDGVPDYTIRCARVGASGSASTSLGQGSVLGAAVRRQGFAPLGSSPPPTRRAVRGVAFPLSRTSPSGPRPGRAGPPFGC